MVTVEVPVVAVADAASVRVLLVPVAEAGLNVAVAPLGRPLAVKATLPVKPPVRAMVTVLAPLAPWVKVRLDGLADSVKLGVAVGFTVKLTVAVRVSPPPVPVTVTFVVPVAAVADAARVRVLLAPLVEPGLNVAVTPLGRPLAVKATLPVKPPARVIPMVLAPLAPWLTVRLDGVAASVKLGPPGPCHVRSTCSAGFPRGL
jgi:hypothetical protein